MKIRVVKRDKEVEDFDPTKITRVVTASGLSKEEADKLTDNITSWLEKRGKEEVTSVQIRDRVIVDMQKINREAANKFIDYEKYKDKHFGINY